MSYSGLEKSKETPCFNSVLCNEILSLKFVEFLLCLYALLYKKQSSALIEKNLYLSYFLLWCTWQAWCMRPEMEFRGILYLSDLSVAKNFNIGHNFWTAKSHKLILKWSILSIKLVCSNLLQQLLEPSVMIFVGYLLEIRYFESRKPIIPTWFRYCVKLHYYHISFRVLSAWNCFNGQVRYLNLQCAW